MFELHMHIYMQETYINIDPFRELMLLMLYIHTTTPVHPLPYRRRESRVASLVQQCAFWLHAPWKL